MVVNQNAKVEEVCPITIVSVKQSEADYDSHRGSSMRTASRVTAAWLGVVLLLMAAPLAARADNNMSIGEVRTGDVGLEEVASTPDSEAHGWQSLYSAYACVCHHSYAFGLSLAYVCAEARSG